MTTDAADQPGEYPYQLELTDEEAKFLVEADANFCKAQTLIMEKLKAQDYPTRIPRPTA